VLTKEHYSDMTQRMHAVARLTWFCRKNTSAASPP